MNIEWNSQRINKDRLSLNGQLYYVIERIGKPKSNYILISRYKENPCRYYWNKKWDENQWKLLF